MTMTPRQEIARIDRQIDGLIRDVIKLVGYEPEGPEGWQEAWDAHPEHYNVRCGLYLTRGLFQIERDRQEAVTSARQPRAKKCPTCGAHTLRAA